MRTCFQVEERIPMNRTGLKRLRNSGRLPAVVFGSGTDNQNIHLSTKEFGKWIRRGSGGIIELNLENHDSIPVLLEAIQRDPVTQEYIHVDFLRVKKDELVRTKVNIEFAGTPRGTKLGGIVQTQSTFIEIESFPDKIPGSIIVDISHLEIGESIHVGDIELPDGLVLISATNELLVSVVTPKVQAEDIEETVEA
ncbi:50S ribosomal protein L25 [Paenibacillus motobuensis]|uniref:50S ribosomal protein L25 n=1 Tax=Paenibacillus TaxID=44249 RepID=UPI00203FD7A9|nr:MULTISPECIES: 50S ribosomal protein L25 [Paenibacillus]MCM3038941.1 50S ribosomal protein L25 [Paenibacillus lutimineralis]MCM3646045.1 50S ribosomal protein L25 [Paenibacillus motobuensis]